MTPAPMTWTCLNVVISAFGVAFELFAKKEGPHEVLRDVSETISLAKDFRSLP